MHRGGETAAVEETRYLASVANGFGLAYLHVMRADFFGLQTGDVVGPAREVFGGTLVVNTGYDAVEAREGIESGRFDAVAFGTKFLANPDLPARIASGAGLNDPRADLFYTPGPEGYTDYPSLPRKKEEEEKEEEQKQVVA